MIFCSTSKTSGILGACDAGVSIEEDNPSAGEDICDFSTNGMQEYELVNRFDLNKDVGWLTKGEGKPNIPPHFVNPTIRNWKPQMHLVWKATQLKKIKNANFPAVQLKLLQGVKPLDLLHCFRFILW